MHSQSLVVIATMLPALLLTGCNRPEGVHSSAQPEVRSTGDPVVDAYYGYRAALDVMMRSGGRSTGQLARVMTPELVKSISQQAKYYRDNRLRNTGATRVVWAERTLIADGVVVRACYDTRLARTVDSAGRNVLPSAAPTR